MAKILIIEDEVALQDAIKSKLQQLNHEVLTANNGEEGLEMALSSQPDLILLDLLMPKITGEEVLTKLRASGEWGENAKVIVLTNFDPDNEMLSKMSSTAPAYYILKASTSLEEVVEKINSVLGI